MTTTGRRNGLILAAALILPLLVLAGAIAGCSAPSAHPSKHDRIRILTAALNNMRTHYRRFRQLAPGAADILDYRIGAEWKKGIDGFGTTVAVIEGWDDPRIKKVVRGFDKRFGLPNPQIRTIFPAGKRPAKCPPGMVRLGSYGSCAAWRGELELDVLSVHLIAPYAMILISVTPADSEMTDDAASQVAPPEMMEALEHISRHHLANVISISDGTGESTYSHGRAEITAQDPGELSAAAAGIPVVVGTGDCLAVQNLAVANAQCNDTTRGRATAAWDASPWVTAVGGSVPNLDASGQPLGPDPIWRLGDTFGEGAGYSAIFARPGYQNRVASITRSARRSVPDIVMDAQHGTSQAGPLLAGVLALATQLNRGNVGPVNQVLYGVLGPRRAAAGIADVVSGNNSVRRNGKVAVRGFYAARGFDVASGWGTIKADRFVPSLVAATRARHQDRSARRQAAAELSRLEGGVRLTPGDIGTGATARLSAVGFLPLHPVTLYIDSTRILTLTASTRGSVGYTIDPSALRLAPGQHVLRLGSMLLTARRGFHSG